jgi:ribose 5-phosphate isomerase B
VKITVGADEANPLTDAVVADLQRRGHDVRLLTPTVWPDVAQAVGEDVASGAADQGVLFCWTGTGTAIAANKIPGVRAALVWEPWIAEGARKWNDANVLVMSCKRVDEGTARQILDAWFAVEAPDPDEAENIARIAELERRYGRRPTHGEGETLP